MGFNSGFKGLIICLRIVFGGHLPTLRRSYRVAPQKEGVYLMQTCRGALSGKVLLPCHAVHFSEMQRKINVFGLFWLYIRLFLSCYRREDWERGRRKVASFFKSNLISCCCIQQDDRAVEWSRKRLTWFCCYKNCLVHVLSGRVQR